MYGKSYPNNRLYLSLYLCVLQIIKQYANIYRVIQNLVPVLESPKLFTNVPYIKIRDIQKYKIQTETMLKIYICGSRRHN